MGKKPVFNKKGEAKRPLTLQRLLLKGEVKVPLFWKAVMADLSVGLRPEQREIPERFLTDEFILQTLPSYYRLVNKCLVTGGTEPLYELLEKADLPMAISHWALIVGRCLDRFNAEANAKREESVRTGSDDWWPEGFKPTPVEVHAIRCLRQCCGLYSRLTYKSDDTEAKELAAIEEFEQRVQSDARPAPSRALPFVGRVLMKGLSFKVLTPNGNETPPFEHGPGVVAERGLEPWQKEAEVLRTDDGTILKCNLDPAFFRQPFAEEVLHLRVRITKDGKNTACVVGRHLPLADLEQVGPRSARLCAVPKDFRGPRLIAAEPAQNQYVMGGMSALIRQHLRTHPLCRKIMNLNDQTESRERALLASWDNTYATLDLKDASDLVRVWHLEELLRYRVDLLEMILGVRTGRVELPDGRVINMTSLFTMGSKLTFPIESIVYASELIAAYLEENNLTFTEDDVALAIDSLGLWVYGDDIIVYSRFAVWAIQVLKRRGYVPNQDKCCYRTPFRESCGMDAFCGYDVTPLRPRLLPGASEQSLTSYVDMIRSFAERGLKTPALVLYKVLKYHGIDVPIVEGDVTSEATIASDVLFDLCDRDVELQDEPLKAVLNCGTGTYPFSSKEGRVFMRDRAAVLALSKEWCLSYSFIRRYWSWKEGPKLIEPETFDLQRYRSNLIRGAGDQQGGYPDTRIRLRKSRCKGAVRRLRTLSPERHSELLAEAGLDPSGIVTRRGRVRLTH